MQRGIHITIALVAVVLLAKPFDCFASGTWTKKAADCCNKGKCAPTANADECCKGMVPDGNQFVASKAADDSAPVSDLVSANELLLGSPLFSDFLFVVH